MEGQRLEKNGANNNKDRYVTSETESDHEDSGEGEPRSAGETTQADAKIAEEELNRSPAPGGTGFFADGAEITNSYG